MIGILSHSQSWIMAFWIGMVTAKLIVGLNLFLWKYLVKYDYYSCDVAMSVVGDTVFVPLFIQQPHSILSVTQ